MKTIKIIILLIGVMMLDSCNTIVTDKDHIESITRLCEQYGYWEGQKDALHGKIQIDTTANKWLKFPMIIGIDTEKKQYYNPVLSEDENIKIQLN